MDMLNMAWIYHQDTEYYDQTVCTRRRGKIAVPATPQERGLICANARKVLKDIHEMCGMNTEQKQLLRNAIREVAREFEEALQREGFPPRNPYSVQLGVKEQQ